MKFQKGHKPQVPHEARVRAGIKMQGCLGSNWKGGKPECSECGKTLSVYKSKTGKCAECYRKSPTPSKIKGTNIQTNTGRTHFKKGLESWNKGIPCTEEFKQMQSELKKGGSNPKPKNFVDTMRKANPPIGRKIKFDSRDKEKKLRVWRHGYVFVYKPEHPTSRKIPPDYGYIAEHRMIMELHLGRDLKPTEVIHHLDGLKSNNKIENLLCCETQRKHNQIHTKMQVFVEKLIRENKVYYDKEFKEFKFR